MTCNNMAAESNSAHTIQILEKKHVGAMFLRMLVIPLCYPCCRAVTSHLLSPTTQFLVRRMTMRRESAVLFRSQRPPAAVDDLIVAEVISVIGGHTLVKWMGRGRACQACARSHRKTANGRFVNTSFGCETRRAYLCRSGGCFRQYHQ